MKGQTCVEQVFESSKPRSVLLEGFKRFKGPVRRFGGGDEGLFGKKRD